MRPRSTRRASPSTSSTSSSPLSRTPGSPSSSPTSRPRPSVATPGGRRSRCSSRTKRSASSSRLGLAELTDEDRRGGDGQHAAGSSDSPEPCGVPGDRRRCGLPGPPRRLEAPDVDSLSEQYEESPASLGAYCATALTVADVERGRSDDRRRSTTATTRRGMRSRRTPVRRSPTGSARRSARSPIRSCWPASSTPDRARRSGRSGPPTGTRCLVIDTFDDAAPKLESLFLRLEADGGRRLAGIPCCSRGSCSTPTSAINPRYGRWDPTTISVVPLGT